MKHTILLLLITGLLLSGCKNEDSIVGPVTPGGGKSVESEPNWIELPAPSNPSLFKTFSTFKLVRVKSDTELIIDESYRSRSGEIKVSAKLKFYAGAVDKDTYVKMQVNDRRAMFTFGPSMKFNTPAELYAKFEGLDLDDVEEDEIKFVYLSPRGKIEKIEYKEIKIDEDSGTLELVGALIPHFSRFGFVR